MKKLMRLTAPALVLALVPSMGLAADYEPSLYPAEEPVVDEYKPVEIGSGWYIRGDIGYAVRSSDTIEPYRTYNGGIYGTHAWDTARVKSEWDFSAGVGYRYNDWLRGDATFDAFRGSFKGTTSDPFSCGDPLIVTTTCASNDNAAFTAYSAMANVYADLGTFVGITPYVGAGAGVTWLNWGTLTNSSYCVDGTAACPAGAATTTTHPGIGEMRLTWALMAGASYDISKNLKLDMGYRFRKISAGDMFGFDTASRTAGATGAQGRDKGLTSHDIRVGLRYEIW